MIKIYLTCVGSETPFLSIPLSNVQRLSIQPFKWLRYVMFCICGARGKLSAGPAGPETGLAAPPPNILHDAQNGHTFRTDLTVRAARLLNFTLRFHLFFSVYILDVMNNNTK